jgi:hypothetical protein
MLRVTVTTALVALASPAFAQTTSGAVSDTAGMAQPAQSADPGTIRVENTPEQAALADRAVPEVIATEGEVKIAVDSQWFKYDLDRNGGLDTAEFGKMLRKFRKVAAAPLKDGPADEARADAAAFAQADIDKDGKVNRDEFVGLLKSPAA